MQDMGLMFGAKGVLPITSKVSVPIPHPADLLFNVLLFLISVFLSLQANDEPVHRVIKPYVVRGVTFKLEPSSLIR